MTGLLRRLRGEPPAPREHPPDVQEAIEDRDQAIAVAVSSVKNVDRVNAMWDEYEKAEKLREDRKKRGRSA